MSALLRHLLLKLLPQIGSLVSLGGLIEPLL